jgi:hypothetical protein
MEKQHAHITTVATASELRGIKLKNDRGTITKITFEITYPDHSKKIIAHDFAWIKKLSGIHFDEVIMSDEEKKIWFVSENWEDNPAFIKISKTGKRAGSCCKRPGHSGDDCWRMSTVLKRPKE